MLLVLAVAVHPQLGDSPRDRFGSYFCSI